MIFYSEIRENSGKALVHTLLVEIEMPELKKEPFEAMLSPKVKIIYGYKDAHAQVRVLSAMDIPVNITPDQIEKVKEVFDLAREWALKSEAERKSGKGDIEKVLDGRAKACWSFPDGHVSLYVRPFKISPWIPITISREELLEGKKIMDEVHGWAKLPQDVRTLQGI